MTGNFPKRGDVYWAALDPAVGSETRKTRPCLIVSNDIGNEASNLVIISTLQNFRIFIRSTTSSSVHHRSSTSDQSIPMVVEALPRIVGKEKNFNQVTDKS